MNGQIIRRNVEPTTCLVVGLGGRVTDDYIPNLAKSSRIVLTGVCDSDPNVAGRVPDAVPFFADLDEAIDKLRPTMAVVATPHHTHLDITKRLINAGVAVLKEKPFTLNLMEAWDLSGHITERGGYIRIAVQRQFNSIFAAAKRSIADLGRLRHFNAAYHLSTRPYEDTWRASRAKAGGGALIDMGYHTLDTLVSYFGMPQRVTAVSVAGRGDGHLDVEESVAATFEYSNGLVGRIFISRCEPIKHESLTVVGTDGSLVVGPGTMKRRNKLGQEIATLASTPAWQDGVGEILDEFIATLNDTSVSEAEIRRGLEVMTLTDALYTSLECQGSIEPVVPDRNQALLLSSNGNSR